MNGDRVTIVLDPKLTKLLRDEQAKQIRTSQTSISFSKVLNEIIAKHYKLKNYEYKSK